MKTAVITGADGFIGSHLVKKLVREGYEVWGLTVPESTTHSRIEHLDHVHVLAENLNDYMNYASKLPDSPDAFFHLAWAGVAPEARDDMEVQQNNITLALNMARLAAEIHAQRFIFPGSTAEYWSADAPINENTLPSPANAYGAAKISCRYLLSALCEELHLPFCYCVITGIYASDRKDNNVIYYTISTLLKGEKPKLTACEQLWDYVNIDDVMEAFYRIAEKGKNGRFYCIGHGDNQPLYRYIETIRNIIGKDLSIGFGEVPYKDGKLPYSCVDLSTIEKDTGYQPKISFEDGIRDVIQAVKKNVEI